MIDTNYEAVSKLLIRSSEKLQQYSDVQQKRIEDTKKADLERREASENAWNALVTEKMKNLTK